MFLFGIRIGLSFSLIYFVYQETGWATALYAFLTTTYVELNTYKETKK